MVLYALIDIQSWKFLAGIGLDMTGKLRYLIGMFGFMVLLSFDLVLPKAEGR
jgi:hypothetical protein